MNDHLVNYGAFYIMWVMISKINHKIFKYQNKIWINNNNNFLNAMLIVISVMYEKYNGIIPTTNSMFYFSTVSFYVFDMKRLEIYSLFWVHHILTIFMVLTMQSQVDVYYMEIARNIIFIFELGNLPIYLVCGMKTSVYKPYWEDSLVLKISMIFEFIWFLIFRCFIPLLFIPKLSKLYGFYLSIFILASIKWAMGMFASIRKQFSKQLIKQPERFSEKNKSDTPKFYSGARRDNIGSRKEQSNTCIKSNKRKLSISDIIDDDYKYPRCKKYL